MSATLKHHVRIDVSDLVDLPGPLETAATIHLPESGTPLSTPLVVVFGLPGGGYSRGYWDIDEPGFARYSEAEYHTARGWVFVACDHLGVGDSSLPDSASLTFEMLAAANHGTVTGVLRTLKEGALDERLGAIEEPPFCLGMGQSMGGGLLIIQQGLHATFDAVAVLGYSSTHTVIPAMDDEGTGLVDTQRGESSVTMADYVANARPGLFRVFHWEDVPDELVNADLADVPRLPDTNPKWGSLTTPNVCFTMTSEGCVAKEAAMIRSPVFVGAGVRDVVPSIRTEPAGYPAATDITVFEVPRMAHMHNFAGTRAMLWERLHTWADGQARDLKSKS